MTQKFSLIAAADLNRGIGKNGKLPWMLKQELKHFNAKTTQVNDPSKMNAVIMGRNTYFGIPPNKRPLPNRLNIILSKTSKPCDYPSDVRIYPSLTVATEALESDPMLRNEIENIWIVGGYGVYLEAMHSSNCHRIYLTEIQANFDCDAFFPMIPHNNFKQIPNDADLPSEIQEENGIKYQYKIYEKID